MMKEAKEILKFAKSLVAVKILIDKKETEAARGKFGGQITVGRFMSSIPLFRALDGEELRDVLRSGGFRGGEYSVPSEREYGAQWGNSLSEVAKWGNSQRGSRLGYEIFVAEIDGKGHMFAHLSGANGKMDLEQEMVDLDSGFCNTGLGCSVRVPARMVKAWYVVEGGVARRITLDEAGGMAEKAGLKKRKVEFFMGSNIRLSGNAYNTLRYLAVPPQTEDEQWSLEFRDLKRSATLSPERLSKEILSVMCKTDGCMSKYSWLLSREKAKSNAMAGPTDAYRGFAVMAGITVETSVPNLEANFGEKVNGIIDFVSVWMPREKKWRTVWSPTKKITLSPSGVKIGSTTPLPDSFSKDEPAMMTKDEFIKHRNPKDETHPSEAYDTSLKKMNEDYSIHLAGWFNTGKGEFIVFATRDGFMIREKGTDKLAGIVHAKTLYFSDPDLDMPDSYWGERDMGQWKFVKMDVEKKKRVKYLDEYVHLVSNAAKRNGIEFPYIYKNFISKGERLQVRFESAPKKDSGSTMVVMNGDGLNVGMASNEWGTTLLQVVREYRGRGIGKLMGKIWYGMNPKFTSGGFTPAGMANSLAIWEDSVREFMARGWYSDMVKSGRMTMSRVKEIISGVGVKSLPKQQEEKKVGPKSVLVYVDGSSFVIYDESFLEDQDDRFIYGYGFFRSSDDKYFLYRIDYERKYQGLASSVAMQMAKDEGEKVWIGKGYGDMLELENIAGVAVDGDLAWLTRNILPLGSLASKERSVRKNADPYGEKLDTLKEMAESKW